MSEADLPNVGSWLAEPHVRRWWRSDVDAAAVAAKYEPRLRGEDPTHMLIIEADGAAVGLAQWYRWDDHVQDRDNYRIGAGELGIDYLIGELSACGRGLGTAIVAGLLDRMRASVGVGTPVSVAVQTANVASRRILEKNGFAHVTTFQTAHGQGRAPEEPTAVYRRPL